MENAFQFLRNLNDGSCDPLLNGELGTLVNPDSKYEIANAIFSVLLNDKQDNILSRETLRNRILSEFGYNRFTDGVSNLISILQ